MKLISSLFLTAGLLLSTFSEARPARSKGVIKDYGAYVAAILAGSFDSQGFSFRAFMDPNLPSWKAIGKDIDFDLSIESCLTLHCDGYQLYDRDLSFVTGSRPARADRVELLPERESFAKRAQLFEEARESIYIMTWAVYDDETGAEFEEQMMGALARNPQLDIRIIVDGNVATMTGHGDVLRNLELRSEGRIQVMRWKTWKYRANGTHRKMIIVDKRSVIVGGTNIGNSYAHYPGAPAWRDLDMLAVGDSVGIASHNQFVEVWNAHDSRKIELQKPYMKPIEVDEEATEGIPMVVMDQHPGSTNKRAHVGVHTGVVKLLRNARSSVDIENAYLIMDPVLKKELKAALERGVRVRLFTNSKESVDMPLVSNPILKSAKQLAKWGADVYLKKGTTLHSKYLIVDQKLSMVGSFNFHPRSLRFDGENAVVIIDERFAAELTAHFEKGISEEAVHVESPSLLKIAFNLLAAFTQFFYFDFL